LAATFREMPKLQWVAFDERRLQWALRLDVRTLAQYDI